MTIDTFSKDFRLSFFDPVSNIGQGKIFSVGRFGEWFFNFNCKKVYEIRKEGPLSNEGTEVILTNKAQKSPILNIVIRVALAITVLPVVIAFLDKVCFRFSHPDLHVNPLTDEWKTNKPGYLLEKKEIQYSTNQLGLNRPVFDTSRLKVNSVLVRVTQTHPWLNPDPIQVIKIDDEGDIFTLDIGNWVNEDKGFVIFDGKCIFFNSPEALIEAYRKKDKDLIVATEIATPSETIPPQIKEYAHYKAEFKTIGDYNKEMEKNKNEVSGNIFYCSQEGSYMINIRKTCFLLKYENNTYQVPHLDMENEDLIKLVDSLNYRFKPFHDIQSNT